MAIYGYHRTSTADQHLDRGLIEIEKYCKEHDLALKRIYTDKISGKIFDRPRYTVLKEDILRSGDTLIITETDRLGRNKAGILEELRYFRDNDIRVMILEIPTTLIDFSTMDDNLAKLIMETINNLLIEMFAALAQAEMEKKEKRQREGIEAKKARGEWDDYGRPRVMEPEAFKEAYSKVLTGELKPFECMRQLGMKKSTFYHYCKQYL